MEVSTKRQQKIRALINELGVVYDPMTAEQTKLLKEIHELQWEEYHENKHLVYCPYYPLMMSHP